MAKKNCSNIGGQAVIEGVMMRGKSAIATAVRNSDGEILVESSRFQPKTETNKAYKVPIIRGILSFFGSMVMGIKILNRSSEVFGDLSDEEPSKFEKWLAKTFKVDIMNVLIVFAIILALALSVGIFILIPQGITTGIFKLAKWSSAGIGMSIAYNLIAGVIRMAIFVGYIALVSKVKDIKRVFMYHGAEHKVISCFEHNLDLTVENAQKMTTVHDRCGTTFMFLVMVVSILFFAVFPVDLLPNSNGFVNFVLRVLSRIILVPVVAGISYEFLKLFAKFDNKFVKVCKAPGLWLQKLTTQQPTDDMVEVSIMAFTEVMKLEEDANYPTKEFVVASTIEKVVAQLTEIVEDKNKSELIVMFVLGVKTKSELYDGRRIFSDKVKECTKFAERHKKGAPLQYCLGNACFYGYDFYVDSRVLIPRFDTEILVENALKVIKLKENPTVLDMCTGSGCIAITIKKEYDKAIVKGVDLSLEAIEVAKQNSQKLEAEVEFVKSDLFKGIKGEKFDYIISNPPYIQSMECNQLENQVKDYEPRMALDGGADGLDFYRDIVAKSKNYLNEEGYLIFEVGVTQAELVCKLMTDFEVSVFNDYNTPPIPRVVMGKLKKGE